MLMVILFKTMRLWLTSQNTMKFEMMPKEVQAYKEFESECGNELCSIEFIPGSIGTTVIVKCKALNKEKNITDYDAW